MTKPSPATVTPLSTGALSLRVDDAELTVDRADAAELLDALTAYFADEDGGPFSAETIAALDD